MTDQWVLEEREPTERELLYKKAHSAASIMQSKGRPRRPGLKARDPTWTAQQVFDHSRRNA